ncbi:MAG: hypothetical protein RBT33_02495 [Candidatus Dojkabacteria bacterium]|jgi:hypothetical protein|nr:hypothetical protein [Candidatus Dojkabacteria bacterium]
MELKEILNESESVAPEAVDIAFDRLEEKDIVFCSFQYKKNKNTVDKDSPRVWSKSNIELNQEEDIYPLEQILVEEGFLPEDFHFSSLNLSILKRVNSSLINPLDFHEMTLSIESSKLFLSKESYPNIAQSYSSLLGLFLNLSVKRLRGISYHDDDKNILEAKNISGEIRSSDRNFNVTKYESKKHASKKVEIEDIRELISSRSEILKEKEKNKEFTNLEVKFINWATQLLERKGL